MNDIAPDTKQDAGPSRTASVRGASFSKITFRSNISMWIQHHRISAMTSLRKLLKNPLSSLMIWMVIGIAMSLPISLFLVVENIKEISGRWEGKPQFSVYMKQNISEAVSLKFRDVLQQNPDFVDIRYVSPSEGLEEFKQYSGFGDALVLLDENPLPAVYIIKPLSNDPDKLTSYAKNLQAYPDVDFVQIDTEWIQKLHQITILIQRFVYWLSGLLLLGVLLVISNTTRLAIENRREEIVVVKLVGGTDAYVRRPLLYTGFWYGLFGATLACLLIHAGVSLLADSVGELARLYDSNFIIKSLGAGVTITLLVAGGMVGVLGSWIATSIGLRAMQPR